MNVLVCGRMGSGKTTLLRALVGEVDEHDVIVTVETDFELNIAKMGHAPLRARLPGARAEHQRRRRHLVSRHDGAGGAHPRRLDRRRRGARRRRWRTRAGDVDRAGCDGNRARRLREGRHRATGRADRVPQQDRTAYGSVAGVPQRRPRGARHRRQPHRVVTSPRSSPRRWRRTAPASSCIACSVRSPRRSTAVHARL